MLFANPIRIIAILMFVAVTWLRAADGTGLIGSYFDNADFTGSRIVRTDATVDFDWAGGAPVEGIGADTFAVRWTGQVEALATELVTFSTVSDDGIRLWVDHQLIIDHWSDHGAYEDHGMIALVAGQRYDITLEFYENGGSAIAKLLWSSPAISKQVVPQSRLFPSLPVGTGTGLLATYFDNANLTGITVVRTDATVNADWAGGSPDPAIGPDTFSARWVGEVEPRFSETYTFTTTSDDGVRLWIGGTLIIDSWLNQAAAAHSGTIALMAGVRYPLVMEYYENGGAAVAKLSWSSASTLTAIVPSTQLYPIAPAGSGSGLLATYFDNQDFTGTAVTRMDATVDFTWGGGSPDPAIAADTFSARWTGEVEARTSEPYTLFTTSDDGVRLWVDGQLLIDHWTDHGAVEDHGTITLTAGRRAIVVMEFYERYGAAVAKLAWSSPTIAKAIIPATQLHPAAALGTGTGLLAQYYDEKDLSGPAQLRIDAGVDFDWGGGPPLSGIGPDTFSVRWSGEVQPRYSEAYTFRTTSDDGIRLWLGGQLLIDHWNDHGPSVDQTTILLVAGQRYPLVLEYYENGGGAVAKLAWSSPSTALGPIPANQLYPAPVVGTGTGLLATYFDNQDFTGTSLARVDPVVDFDWAGGSPASSIGVDTFSAHWVGEIQAEFSETVTFQTVSDDGIRLWVDGQLLIDHWNDHGATVDGGSIALVAGHRYAIAVDYYEHGGSAVARLRWSSPRLPLQAIPTSQLYPTLIAGSGTGLTATYFDNRDFTGTAVSRLEPAIAFDWGAGSPSPSIGPDTFSARWTGEVQPYVSETYTFTTISDDGIRVWIGNQLIIDHWSDHAASARSGSIALVGGLRYPITVEYYENGGAAVAKLLWASPSTPAGVVPSTQLYPSALPANTVATPVFTPPGGTFGDVVAVTLVTSTSGAVIRYTLDGSDPTVTSPLASGPVTIAQSAMLTARGFLSGWNPSAAAGATYNLVALAPVILPPGGSFSAPQVVTLTSPTTGGELRYTLDGSSPGASSPLYAGPITVAANATLTARVFRAGWTPSAAISATFAFKAVAPVLTPPGGGFTAPQVVTLSTATAGGEIRYTLDGSDPTAASSLATGPVTIDRNATLMARTFRAGWTASDASAGVFSFTPSAPTIAPANGTFSDTVSVTLTSATSGAEVRYTLDGSDPTPASFLASGAIAIDRSTNVSAKAFKAGWLASATASATYNVVVAIPTIAPPAGIYDADQVAVALATSTSGAVLHYTIDGSDPTPASPVYSTPFPLNGSATVKAIALRAGCTSSGIASATYEIRPLALPQVSVVATADANEAGAAPGAFAVTRTGDATSPLPVSYLVAGSATSGDDYAPLSGTLILPAGSTSAIIAVTPIDDVLSEGDETVTVSLLALPSYQLVGAGSATIAISDNDVASITIDRGIAFQTIAGIGGNFAIGRFTGSLTPNDAVGAITLAQLHPTHARVGIPLKAWLPVSRPASGGVPADGYRDTAQAHNVFLLMQDLAQRGIPLVASVWDAPDWLVENPGQVTGRRLLPDSQPMLIEALAAFLVHARDLYGVTVDGVSINEADGGFSLALDAAATASLIANAVPCFRQLGLGTAWMAGDTSNATALPSFAAPVLADAALRPSLVALSFHSWDATAPDATFAVIAGLAATNGLPVWCTEVGYDPQLAALSPSPFPTWDHAWRLALISHRVLTLSRASVLDYWSYQDDFPLAGAGGLFPAGVVVKQLADQLAPGSHLVSASASDARLWSLAAVHAPHNHFMTQVINTGSGSLAVRLVGLPDQMLAIVRTSAGERLAPVGTALPVAGQLALTLPAQSITTLSGLAGAGPDNQPPVVDAGADRAGVPGQAITLGGQVSDDGLPSGGALVSTWSLVSGPGTVAFADVQAPATLATFSAPGVYRLRLKASDGAASHDDAMLVSVADAAALRINFQPSGVPVPPGYLPDHGEIFADRGNGFSYGWSSGNVTGVRRLDPLSPDLRYDSFLSVPAVAGAWEIAVPNGDYRVRVVAGDASAIDSVYGITVEGMVAVAGTPTVATHWLDGTVRVTVNDGRLTIGSMVGAVNNKLCFVDIDAVPASPAIAFQDAAMSAIEGQAGAVQIRLVLDRPASAPVTVQVTVIGGTATPGSDYQPLASGTVAIATGQSTVDLALVLIDDARHEADQTVDLVLSSPVNAFLGVQATHRLTIIDNDPLPTVSFAAATTSRGEATGVVPLHIVLSGPSEVPVTVLMTRSGGTASDGLDLTATPPVTLTFPVDVTDRVVDISLINDSLYEGDETATWSLSASTGAMLGLQAGHALTIVDDDVPPTFAFATAASSVAQDAGVLSLPLVFAPVSGLPAHVSYTVGVGGTAVVGTDFTIVLGTCTVAAGTTGAGLAVPLTILPSGAVEDRTVVITLGAPQAAGLVQPTSHTVTIRGTGGPVPSASFATATSAAAEGSGSVAIAVTLDQASANAVAIAYHVTGGSGTNGASGDVGVDYTLADGQLTIPALATTGTITVPVYDDAAQEPDETVMITLVASPGVTLGDITSHTHTIVNDDLPMPVGSYVLSTPAGADVFGLVPSGFTLSGLVVDVTAPTSVIGFTGAIEGGVFHAHIDNANPPVANATITLAFADTSTPARIGPATTLTVPFGDGAGGGTSSGDPGQLPPTAPHVSLTIASGLTGKQHEMINDEDLHFTKKDEITVTVSTLSSLGTISDVTLFSSDGQSIPVSGGSVTLPTPSEGRFELTATAVATNAGQSVSGSTDGPVILIVDRTPPRLRHTLPQRYWPADINQQANPPPEVPLRHSLTDDRDLVLLNKNIEADNKELREQRFLNVFDRAGFTGEAVVDDVSGLNKDVGQLVVARDETGANVSLTLTVRAPVNAERGDPQTVLVEGFTKLPDSVEYDQVVESVHRGRHTLRVTLEDRAGNRLENHDEYCLWVKRQPPTAKLGIRLSQEGAASENDETQLSPARFIVATSDTLEAWQDSRDDAHRLSLLRVGADTFWLLHDPKALPSGSSTTVSLILRDRVGNLSDAVPVTMSQSKLENASVVPFFEGEDVWNSYPGGYVFELPVHRDAGSTRIDDFLWSIYTTSNRRVPLINHGGNVDGSLTWTIQFSLPDELGLGAMIDYSGVSAVTARDATDDVVKYSRINVSPLDVGADPDRRFTPGVLTIPPSWVEAPPAVTVQVRDQGIASVRQTGVVTAELRLPIRTPQADDGVFDATTGPGNDSIRAEVDLRRTIDDPDAPAPPPGERRRQLIAAFPGMAQISYSVLPPEPPPWSGQGDPPPPHAPYDGTAAYRWFNLIRLTPDVIASGSRVTVRIEAGFLDQDFALSQFLPDSGDYVHFRDGDSDLTESRSEYETHRNDPQRPKDRISITSQRLIPSGAEAGAFGLVQSLELDLEIGPEVPTKMLNVDVKLGAVKAYTDALSAVHAADESHRMQEALKIFKPDVVPTVPKFAECLHKRSGKADEPVIIMNSGGDKSVSDCSLVGYEEGDKNVWNFSAKYDQPIFEGDQAGYGVVWDLDGGQVVSGFPGSGIGDGSNTISVKYRAGQHTPTLRVYRSMGAQTSLVGTASIHTIHVYSRYVDGAAWTLASIPDDDRYGSETKLERKTDEGVGVNVQVRVGVKAQGACRARLSPDGYPQNEYWVKGNDGGDLPQPYVFKPRESKKGWTQGYGDPSLSADNFSIKVNPSKSYEEDETNAKFTTATVDAMVDANRDQNIAFDGTDHTSVFNPYRFWLNNNHDERVQSEGGITDSSVRRYEEDDITGQADSVDNRIGCQRDLEDFSRYWVAISNRSVMGSRLRQGDIKVQFRMRSRAQSPQVKMFLAADRIGGLGYLTDYLGVGKIQATDYDNPTANEKYHTAATSAVGSGYVQMAVPGGGSLTDALVPDDESPGSTRSLVPFLFEGVTAGVGDLEVRLTVVLDGINVPLGHGHATIDLRDIKKFYEQWTVGDAPLSFSSQAPTHVASTIIYNDEDRYFSDRKYLLYVHGWNMTANDKDWFANTAYKRLWWNGYKGRFGALRWPTNFGFGDVISVLTDGQNYDASEEIAWFTGHRLAGWLPSLSQSNHCPIDILAHSMGNIVVGNALRLLPGGQESTVGTYIASQAAVPAQLYRPNGGVPPGGTTDTAGCRPWISTVLGFGGWNTANVYRTGLFQNNPMRFNIANFYNRNDYALSEGVSGLNQRFKPDAGRGRYLFGMSGVEATEVEFRDRFFSRTGDHVEVGKNRSPEYVNVYFWSGGLPIGDAATADYESRGFVPRQWLGAPSSQYYIMGYLSESRVYPIGASPGITFGNPAASADVNLAQEGIWPLVKQDNIDSDLSPEDASYSSHRWHSGQFRMTMPEQKEYWKALMKSCQYGTANVLP
jgi:hypothetical protein